MNANPMEEQIGRLVGNLLAGGGEIFLPGVGSLYTERQGARRLNRRTVLPPSRTVAFTSQQRGVSLVDEIARVMREAGGYENPEAEAQAVYDRWIARVHRVDLLTVEGVGELKFKNFIPDEAFDLRLNPQGANPCEFVCSVVSTGRCGSASRQSGLRRSMAGGSSCCSIRRRRKRRP